MLCCWWTLDLNLLALARILGVSLLYEKKASSYCWSSHQVRSIRPAVQGYNMPRKSKVFTYVRRKHQTLALSLHQTLALDENRALTPEQKPHPLLWEASLGEKSLLSAPVVPGVNPPAAPGVLRCCWDGVVFLTADRLRRLPVWRDRRRQEHDDRVGERKHEPKVRKIWHTLGRTSSRRFVDCKKKVQNVGRTCAESRPSLRNVAKMLFRTWNIV